MQDVAFGCNQHLEALGFPEVRKALLDLESNWNNLEPWERGEGLVHLVCCGCSVRGLASLLPSSAKTIRHYMDLADLRLFLLEGRAGFTPERFFRNWEYLQRAQRAKEPSTKPQAGSNEQESASSEAV